MNKHKIQLLILGSLVVVVILPVLLDIVVFGNSIASNLTNGEWAGFLGSYIGALLGGVATLTGIYLTIRANDNQRREDQEIMFKPSLRARIETKTDTGALCYEIVYNFNHPYFSDVQYEYAAISFENVGRGEITDMTVNISSEDEGQTAISQYLLFQGISDSFVPIGDKIWFTIDIPRVRPEREKDFNNEKTRIIASSKITVKYKGILGIRTYTQILEYFLAVSPGERPYNLWLKQQKITS